MKQIYIVTIVQREPTERSNYDLVTHSLECEDIFEALHIVDQAAVNFTLFESVTITRSVKEV